MILSPKYYWLYKTKRKTGIFWPLSPSFQTKVWTTNSLHFGLKRYLWGSGILGLKIAKKWYSFVKKTLKNNLSAAILTFFKNSLFIRDFLLKTHIPWKFGVNPFILHENRLFEYGFHISPKKPPRYGLS